jgi:hypothetical protein
VRGRQRRLPDAVNTAASLLLSRRRYCRRVDFYATSAQVIPVLLRALVWESGYLTRLRAENRSSGFFWTKPRVRAWGLFMSVTAIGGEASALLVLADIAAPGLVTKGFSLLGMAALLGSLAVRLVSDILSATAGSP